MLSIGELARASGVSVRALRHYEHSGLITAQRQSNGYRAFPVAAVAYVERIRTLLANGFTLEQIRPVVSMLAPETGDLAHICPEVIQRYRAKLAELDERIAALAQLRDSASARLAFLEQQQRDGGPAPQGA